MLYNDHFQNFKRYNIPRAQLVIADIPYNLGNKAYASNPLWYIELDANYHKASCERLEALRSQGRLFV